MNVTVNDPVGGPSTPPLSFRYVPVPTITAINPAIGPITGGTSVTLTGTDFEPGSTVSVDGTPVVGAVVNSATSITFTTPAHPVGPASVTVTTVGGPSGP